MTSTATRQYQQTRTEVKIVLSAMWVAMLFVFAFVDIFAFYRADVLQSALDGKIATTTFAADQSFLTLTLAYILLPALMVVLSLLLPARTNRVANIAISLLYTATVLTSCIGETWIYYIAGSIVEAILLLGITTTAWKWPAPTTPQHEASRVWSGGGHAPRRA